MSLAWPVIAAEALHTAFQIIDIAWVGGLGATATAAATTSMYAAWIVFSLASLVNTGMTAHVARAVGAGDEADARRASAQALNLALVLSLAVVAAGVLGARRLFALLGADPAVADVGARYLRVTALAAPATFLYLGGAALMRATGNTRTPLGIVAACVLTNIALDPLLIYGVGPFPRLGAPGAAIATGLCQLGAALAFATLARRGHPSLPLAGEQIGRPDPVLIGRIARVGAPYAAIMASFSLVYLFFARFAARWGAAALAVVGIANRLESICYLPADGFAAASATVVGQNLGAGRPRRAARGVWLAVRMMAAVALALTAIYLAFPRALLRIFTTSVPVLAQGTPYLRVIALAMVATGVESVVAGGFAGAGDTVPPLITSAVSSIVRVPLAWLLAVDWGMGLMGIAWTISSTCMVRAAATTVWFARGRWAA